MVPRIGAQLNELADHRERFEAFCRSLSTEELATEVPDAPWTVGDYIAHLATIESLINPWLGAMAGVTDVRRPDVVPPQPFDLDEWNEAIVATRTGRSLDEIFAEAAANRKRYAEIISRLTDEQLDSRIPFGGDRRAVDLSPAMVPLVDVLDGIVLHDPMHTEDMLRALPDRRNDPHLAEWLGGVDVSRVNPEIAARRV